MGNLVTVGIFHDLPEAHVARSYLEWHGLTVFLADHHFVGAAWHNLFAVGGLRLQVPEPEAEDARRLLREHQSVPDAPAVDRCPACGSEDVFRYKSWLGAALGFLLGGVPFLVPTSSRTCRQCGHEWAITGDPP